MNDFIVKMEGIKGFGNCESNPVSKWMFHYDEESQKVDLLHLGGLMPYARAFVAAMVECPNIKEALSSYQQSYDFEREHLYSFMVSRDVKTSLSKMVAELTEWT